MSRSKRAMPAGFWLRTQVGNVVARRFYERAGMTLGSEEALSRSGEMVATYVWPVTFQIAAPSP